jgi:Peptidase S46
MWPRHAGDFAFLRAYVGPDGKPAEHADNNIPYRPAYHLSIARQPLKTGDLVLVAGYPGTTKRLSTAEETEEAASWYFPRSIGQNRDYLAALDEVIRDRPDLKIKAEPTRRGLLNYLKKNGGVLKTMTEGGLVARRQAEDRALVAWIDGAPERKARYGPALERIRALDADKRKTREADAAFDDLVSKPKLLAQALTIIRVADERAKPDAERNIEYQERNWTRLQQASRAMKRSYAREIDRAVLRLFLRQALALPAAEQPAFVGRLLGKSRDHKAIEAALDRLYRTKLESPEVRRDLLATATLAALRKSADPFIQLALDALPEVKAREAREDAYLGGMAVAMPLYVEARAETRKEPTAPDANGTLRITFGRVLPSPGGGRAFTTLTELAAKSTGEDPFAAPKALLAAIEKKDYRGYVSADLGEVPVDFMSDTDITNGNSGSATLDARGELVGLAFDGTLDTVASDWSYLQNVTRTIHVDVRYMLWLMDVVDHADNVLQELGRK